MKLVDHSKKYKYEDGTDRPDDKIIPFLDNEFVTGFKEDRLFYSKDFDIAMYKKIHDEGMTYVQAYNALGFDTNVLSELVSSAKNFNIKNEYYTSNNNSLNIFLICEQIKEKLFFCNDYFSYYSIKNEAFIFSEDNLDVHELAKELRCSEDNILSTMVQIYSDYFQENKIM